MTPRDFESSYARVAPGLSSFCRMLTRNEAEAEDLFQETWGRALERRGQYREEGSFAGWLCTLARNAWADRRRRQAREARALFLRTPSAESPGREVMEALAALPEDERMAVHLYYFQGFTLRDSAESLGISVWQVRERLASAYGELARILDGLDNR